MDEALAGWLPVESTDKDDALWISDLIAKLVTTGTPQFTTLYARYCNLDTITFCRQNCVTILLRTNALSRSLHRPINHAGEYANGETLTWNKFDNGLEGTRQKKRYSPLLRLRIHVEMIIALLGSSTSLATKLEWEVTQIAKSRFSFTIPSFWQVLPVVYKYTASAGNRIE